MEDFVIIVEGRADGSIEQNGETTIDEIKGTYRDLSKLKAPLPLHIAQAKCYAYMYSLQKELPYIRVRLTYCNIETEDIRYFYEDYEFVRLEVWFQQLISDYRKWADYTWQWRELRQQSIAELQFPFYYRDGQKELVSYVYQTIYHKRKLFIEAPTGVGKTISTIFPTVKAMGKDMGDKLFYLTAKTITRTVAETTINGNIYNEANWADYFWRQVNFDFSLLPENTHYLKIKFGGKGSNAYYDLAISKVQISTVEGVNKRYLEDAVASARARLEAEKDNCGDGDWQYPQTVYDALENACTAAEAVLQNPEAEQAEVDGARDTLLAQTETFRLSQNHLLPLVDECADFDRLLSYTEANLQLSASELALGDNTHFARKKEAPAELVYRVTEDVQFIELEAAVRRTQAEIDAGIMAEDM